MRQKIPVVLAAVLLMCLFAHRGWAYVTATGSFETSYDIDVPAYHGVTPSLSLRYTGRRNGVAGVGWSLAASSVISRVSPTKGTPTFKDPPSSPQYPPPRHDIYLLDGMELIECGPACESPSCDYPPPDCPTCASFATRVKDQRRVALDRNAPGGPRWYVWSPDGTKYTYDHRDEHQSLAYRWKLTSIADASGNTARYTYSRDPHGDTAASHPASYVDAITYGNNTVRFYYESRADFQTNAIGGNEDTANRGALEWATQRLKLIHVLVSGTSLRAYALSYLDAGESGRSWLTSIQLFGTDVVIDAAGTVTNEEAATKLPPTEFTPQYDSSPGNPGDFTHGTRDFAAFDAATDPVQPLGLSSPNGVDARSYGSDSCTFVDVNGDGRTEWVCYEFVHKNPPYTTGFQAIIRTSFYSEAGSVSSTYFFISPEDAPNITEGRITKERKRNYWWDADDNEPEENMQAHAIHFAYINDDQFADIYFLAQSGDGIGGTRAQAESYLGDGHGGFKRWHGVYLDEYAYPRANSSAVGDINGDGLADLVWLSAEYFEETPRAPYLHERHRLYLNAVMGNPDGTLSGPFLRWPNRRPIDGEWYVRPDGDVVDHLLRCAICGPGQRYDFLMNVTNYNYLAATRHFALTLADATGDGLDDAVITVWQKGISEPEFHIRVVESTGLSAPLWNDLGSRYLPVPAGEAGLGHDYALHDGMECSTCGYGNHLQDHHKYRCSDWSIEALDANGDGKEDIVFVGTLPGYSDPLGTYETTVATSLSQGDGTFVNVPLHTIPGFGYEPCGETIRRREHSKWVVTRGDAYVGANLRTVSEIEADLDRAGGGGGLSDSVDGSVSVGLKVTIENLQWSTSSSLQMGAAAGTDLNMDGFGDLLWTGKSWYGGGRAYQVRAGAILGRGDGYFEGGDQIDTGWNIWADNAEHLQVVPNQVRRGFGPDFGVAASGDYYSYFGVGTTTDTMRDTGRWIFADLNGDGDQDAFAAHGDGAFTTLYKKRTDAVSGNDSSVAFEYSHGGPVGIYAGAPADAAANYDALDATEAMDVRRWRILDVNGDGRMDAVYPVWAGTALRIFTLVSTRASEPHAETFRVTYHDTFRSYELRSDSRVSSIANGTSWIPGDVNGDGQDDLVWIKKEPEIGTATIFTLLAQTRRGPGSDFLRWTTKSQETTLSEGGSLIEVPGSIQYSTKAGDFDGDGRVDLVFITGEDRNNHNGGTVYTFLSRRPFGTTDAACMGGGCSIEWLQTYDQSVIDDWELPGTARWAVADVNGDGLSDLVHVHPYGHVVPLYHGLVTVTLINTGSYSSSTEPWQRQWLRYSSIDTSEALPRNVSDLSIADVNGDGKADMVYVGEDSVVTKLSTGTGFASATSWTYEPVGERPDRRHWAFADLDGTGKLQLAYFYWDAASSRLRVHWSSSALQGEAIGAWRSSSGSTTSISYASSVELAGDYNAPSPDGGGCIVPGGRVFDVVHSIEIDNGRVGAGFASSKTDFAYGCPVWDFEDGVFFGFRDVTALPYDEDGVTTKRASTTTRGYSRECGAQIRQAVESTPTMDGTYVRDTLTYNSPGSRPPYDCAPAVSQRETCELGVNCLLSATAAEYDGFGNLVKSSTSAAPACKPHMETFDYALNTDSWIFRKAAESHYEGYTVGGDVVFNEDDAHLRGRTNYCYDNDPAIGPPTARPSECHAGIVGDTAMNRGLLRQTRLWTEDSPTSYVVLGDYQYDSFGNVIQTTDALGNNSTITYDPSGSFPVETCNALDQCSATDWDFTLGLPNYVVDVNGYWQDYTKYDALGRVIATLDRDCNVTTTDYVFWGDPDRQYTVVTTASGTPEQLETYTYHDGLNRTYLVEKSGVGTDGGPSLYKQETIYDGASNRRTAVSHWYEDTGYPLGQADWTSFRYDSVDRLEQTVYANGESVSDRFGANSTRTWTTFTDEMGHERTTYRDMYGQVREVVEYNGQESYTTYYDYDSRGNLISILDDQGNEASVGWNALGQKAETADPDLGTWRYYYDEAGRSAAQVDAAGNTIVRDFDAGGRVTAEHYNGDTSKDVFYVYDWPPAGSQSNNSGFVGRLAAVKDPTCAGGLGDYTIRNGYDEMGRVVHLDKCVGLEHQEVSTTYDIQGRVSTLTYPDGEVVTHAYDRAGRLDSVSGYVTHIGYDPGGRVAEVSLSNGVSESYSHDAVNRLDQIEVFDGSASLFQEKYVYTPDSLLDSVSSHANGSNRSYVYDDLHRLREVRQADWTIQSFDFDSIGNMEFNSAVGSYTYDPTHPHAVSAAGEHSYTYDANGNMTARDGDALTITWNERNLPETINTSSTGMTYAYDYAGARVSQSDGATTTRYFGPLIETDTTTGTKQYYFAGKRRIAEKDSGGNVRFFHQDRLGSTRIMTDTEAPSVNIVGDYHFEEFGKERSHGGAVDTDIKFTGHREATGTGTADYAPLIFMNARYYDPEMGRFISGDTMVPDLTNPQALNRYSYVYNNPTGYTDPTGHQVCEDAACVDVSLDYGDNGAMDGLDVDLSLVPPLSPEELRLIKESTVTTGGHRWLTYQLRAVDWVLRDVLDLNDEDFQMLAFIAPLAASEASLQAAISRSFLAAPRLASGVLPASQLGSLPEAAPGTDTVVLGNFQQQIALPGGRVGIQNTLDDVLAPAASRLGGRTLEGLPRDIDAIVPELQMADRIIFFTSPNLNPMAAAEAAAIQSDRTLLEKTIFIFGGL